ncbi:hypothetical protein GCM10022226_43210 [Sphaerisporangium flaviroseum]|uniref:Uncharacterized protein n=1 Tax=Sphaerisporangium flaviroseum TaxID=509199 RepID=A0ABP7IGN7_9ACTN
MTGREGRHYDFGTPRLISEDELRGFLLDCFDISEHECFVGHVDRAYEALKDVPDVAVFEAYCKYSEVSGHFAMYVELGVSMRLAARVGRMEFARKFAAHYDVYVLCSDDGEPLELWTIVLADGTRLLASLEEWDDPILIYSATVPIPGLPEIRVNPNLEKPWG